MPKTDGSGEHRIFDRWWKSFVSVLLSLAAVLGVIWAIGSKFFATREELIDMKWRTATIDNKVNDVQGSVRKIEDNVETIKIKITELANARRR